MSGYTLFSCDFEADLCGLDQADDDDMDWTRGEGPHTVGRVIMCGVTVECYCYMILASLDSWT